MSPNHRSVVIPLQNRSKSVLPPLWLRYDSAIRNRRKMGVTREVHRNYIGGGVFVNVNSMICFLLLHNINLDINLT